MIRDLRTTQRSRRAAASQRAGHDLQVIAEHRLTNMGFRMVEGIETPRSTWKGRTVYTKKVSGDVKAVEPRDGRAVLVECKWRPSGPLTWTDLADHQQEKLDEQAACRGLALLCWGGSQAGILFLDWSKLRAAGFGPGRSISSAMIAAASYLRERTS